MHCMTSLDHHEHCCTITNMFTLYDVMSLSMASPPLMSSCFVVVKYSVRSDTPPSSAWAEHTMDAGHIVHIIIIGIYNPLGHCHYVQYHGYVLCSTAAMFIL